MVKDQSQTIGNRPLDKFLNALFKILIYLLQGLLEMGKMMFFRLRLVLATILSWAGAGYAAYYVYKNYHVSLIYIIPGFWIGKMVLKDILCVIFCCETQQRRFAQLM